MGRVRKRPSMLSEFHGKHYNHRDADREMPCSPYFRSQYGNFKPHPSFGAYGRYGAGGHHKSDGMDPRRHPYSHHHHPRPNNYPPPQQSQVPGGGGGDFASDDALPVIKRPRLFIDISRHDGVLMEAPNSAESSVSSSCGGGLSGGAAPARAALLSPTQGPGLSAYLEDINSDDDIQDDEERVKKSSPQGQGASGKQTKEELLQMMDRVDRDIAATESQIAALLKKKTELEESSKALAEPPPSAGWVTPIVSSAAAPLSDSPIPDGMSDPEDSEYDDEDDKKVVPPKVTLINTIYAENRLKVKSASAALHVLHCTSVPPNTLLPLYHQPCEIPGYNEIIERHKSFRPKLLQLVQKLKLEHHKKELKLCKEYDRRRVEWEARIEKMENNQKKKNRDARNKELYERLFPELRTKREQMEKFSRVDQRGVRSDAELKELMYELMEQEEAPARYRRTQAVIPPMVIDQREQAAMRFTSNSGLIKDPMALYKESTRIASIWTEEEKRTFRDKFLQYPKNFAVIAECLPNKTTADCIKYYYLCKKNEHFKQLVSKANMRKRKVLFKPHSISMMPQTPLLISSKQKLVEDLPRSVAMSPEEDRTADILPVSSKSAEQEEWTETEIADLKEGLRKYGKAWGKIYREVGSGGRTATQCKQFFDNCDQDRLEELHQALVEHSSIKNAEKARRKAENRKQSSSVTSDAKSRKPCVVEDDSENTESASESEMCSVDSESEGTITDSSPEDPVPHHQAPPHIPASSADHPHLRETNHTLEAMITAAEMLMEGKSSVPLEVALHDHNYALPSAHLMDVQGTSGLSLIAAAAAVVSPSLSRSNSGTCNGKGTVVSPVKAPRGRPPSSQKRSGTHYANKLAPTLLSPAGSSSYVPLTDGKTSMRNRTKSAPVERPKVPIQCRSPSGISRGSSYSRAGRGVLSSVYSKPSSKQHPSSTDLETLVNVALASSPVEMPKSSSGVSGNAAGYLTLALSSAQPSSVQVQCKEGTAVVDMNHVLWALSNPQFHNLLVQTDLLSKLGSPATGSQYNIMAAAAASSPHEVQDQHHQGFEGRTVVLEEAKTPSETTTLMAHHVSGTAQVPSTSSAAAPVFIYSSPDPSSGSVGEELSNLNLLSSLVVAAASSGQVAIQSSPALQSITTASTKAAVEQQGVGVVGSAGNSVAGLGAPKQPHSSASGWSADSVPFGQPDMLTSRLSSLTNTLLPLSTLPAIVPPTFYPSTSQQQQQTLLLYTRSLSYPQSPVLEQTAEEDEEDHLEIASRSINELSMLLSNGSRGDAPHPDGKASALWNATPLPSSVPPCIPGRSSLTTSSTSSSDLYFLDPHASAAAYSVLTGLESAGSSSKDSR